MISIENKAGILAELWINYRDEKGFKPFIEYNDLGLPLAYLFMEGLTTGLSDTGLMYVNESFDLFISTLELDDNEIVEGMNLEAVLVYAAKKYGGDE